MSDRLIEQLRIHEGVETHAYECTAGKITVGVGRNIDPDGGLGLSESEINFLLKNDIYRSRKELSESFDWFDDLDEVRQDGMCNLHFNLGLTRLRGFQKALRFMESGDFLLASEEFLDSRWAEQVGNRADDVAQMIATGEYP
jgi:lysozyme